MLEAGPCRQPSVVRIRRNSMVIMNELFIQLIYTSTTSFFLQTIALTSKLGDPPHAEHAENIGQCPLVAGIPLKLVRLGFVTEFSAQGPRCTLLTGQPEEVKSQ